MQRHYPVNPVDKAPTEEVFREAAQVLDAYNFGVQPLSDLFSEIYRDPGCRAAGFLRRRNTQLTVAIHPSEEGPATPKMLNEVGEALKKAGFYRVENTQKPDWTETAIRVYPRTPHPDGIGGFSPGDILMEKRLLSQ